jgi:thiol-disulfide isomerase/thioredoxin
VDPKGAFVTRRVWVIAGAAVAAVLVVGLVVGLTRGESDDATLRTGGPALSSDVDLPQVAGRNLVTDEPLDIASFEGTPLIVNVWASWCGPCREEAPDILRFTADRPDVKVVGINLNDARANGRDFNAEAGWTHPSIFDPNGALGFDTLKVTTMPTTIYVDSRGRERGRTQGTVTYDDLVSVADRLQ